MGTLNERDPYDTAIDKILAGAGGDVRLALRTVLMRNVELEAQVLALTLAMQQDDPPGRPKH